MTREELGKILENHKHWVRADCNEWIKMKADLYGADLTRANLTRAILTGANLIRANLYGANLTGANLTGANLYGANLTGSNLYGADMTRADLTGANLTGASLYGANLYDAESTPLMPYACPDFGMFIGWKKALRENAKNRNDDVLVELEIPEDARRLSATGRKGRCDKAKVLSIRDMDGNVLEDKEAVSKRDPKFIYKVGETVIVPDFDENRWNECSTGIHFFYKQV